LAKIIFKKKQLKKPKKINFEKKTCKKKGTKAKKIKKKHVRKVTVFFPSAF
jgi:hypothetical protein